MPVCLLVTSSFLGIELVLSEGPLQELAMAGNASKSEER